MEKLSKLPEVASVRTIENFIPTDQQPKLAAIRQLATVLDPVLKPDPNKKPPTDADNGRADGDTNSKSFDSSSADASAYPDT